MVIVSTASVRTNNRVVGLAMFLIKSLFISDFIKLKDKFIEPNYL
jgi:hypothetical protein